MIATQTFTAHLSESVSEDGWGTVRILDASDDVVDELAVSESEDFDVAGLDAALAEGGCGRYRRVGEWDRSAFTATVVAL